MSFLPKEFRSSEEEPGAHFPADDIGPLVNEEGQVAVGLDPFGEGGADDGFAGGPNYKWFLELRGGNQAAIRAGFEAVVGDDGTFFGEALNMLGFLFEEGKGDKERKIGIFVAGGLESGVEIALDIFPKGVAPGLYDHAAADGGGFGEVGGFYNLLIPLGIILIAGGRNGGFWFGHGGGMVRFLALKGGLRTGGRRRCELEL